MSEEDIPTEENIRDLRARISAASQDNKLRLELKLRFQLLDLLYRCGEFQDAITELDSIRALSETLSDTRTSPGTKYG